MTASPLAPHLAVLQGQFKHVRCASNQTHSDAVQYHSFAALQHHRGQMLSLYFTDEIPITVCDCALWGWLIQNCKGKC